MTSVGDVVRFDLRGSVRSGRVAEVFVAGDVEFCLVMCQLSPGFVERLRIATARILRWMPA